MEAMGAASTILRIATAGDQCSTKLITFAGQCRPAEDEITEIAKYVSLNASILRQLAGFVDDGPRIEEHTGTEHEGVIAGLRAESNESKMAVFNNQGVGTVMALARKYKELFNRLNEALQKVTAEFTVHPGSPEQIKLTQWGLLKWPFLQSETDAMRGNLSNNNGTLMLMLQLATLAQSRWTRQRQ